MANRRLLVLRGMIVLVILGMTALCRTDARASLIFYETTIFNGSTPASNPPWLTATFTTVSPGTVTLTLQAGLNVSSEFIDDILFNVDPGITPSALSIAFVSCTGGCVFNTASNTTDNAQTMPGAGSAGTGFDVSLEFDNAPPGNRFNGSELATFTITDLTDLITEASFNFTNTDTIDAHLAAHIQGITCDSTTCSGAAMDGPLPVPEPSSIFLLIMGILGLGAMRRRRRG